VRNQRERLVSSDLTVPLATWLGEWPATGGSNIEKLQEVLRRVPQLIAQMEERVRAKAAEWTPKGIDVSTPTPAPRPAPPPIPHGPPGRPGEE
jgi:hypothetical protein